MTQSLQQSLLAYLPLVVFIGVAGVIGVALLVSAFVLAYKRPIRKNCRPTSAASTPSTTRG